MRKSTGVNTGTIIKTRSYKQQLAIDNNKIKKKINRADRCRVCSKYDNGICKEYCQKVYLANRKCKIANVKKIYNPRS